MWLKKIFSITNIVYFQGIRAQTFRIGALLFIGLLSVAWFLRALSVGQRDVMLRSFTLFSLEISSLILIIFWCVNSFYREKDSRLIYIHLNYFSHVQYLLGRLIGNALIIISYIIIALLISSVVLWFENAWSWSILLGCYSIFLKMSIIIAFANIFCVLLSSPIVSSILTFFVYFSSEFAVYPLYLERKGAVAYWPMLLSKVVYSILPNFDKIDFKYQAIYSEFVSLPYLAGISVYVLIYVLLLYFISLRFFYKYEP